MLKPRRGSRLSRRTTIRSVPQPMITRINGKMREGAVAASRASSLMQKCPEQPYDNGCPHYAAVTAE